MKVVDYRGFPNCCEEREVKRNEAVVRWFWMSR
jgi:hypothetical protein